MRGIPTYTQHSVAFPSVPRRDDVLDDINVSFSAKGGGTYGEFTFEWIEMRRPASIWPGSTRMKPDPRYPYGALRVKAFTDGWGAMLDDRLLGIIRALAKLPDKHRNVSPAKLIEMLEAAGVRPSIYQLVALRDHESTPYERRAEIQRQIDKLRGREEAA